MLAPTPQGLHVAFGWKVLHMAMTAGAQQRLVIGRDTPRGDLSAVALYTKGHVSGYNYSIGFATGERTKGMMTSEFGLVRRGRLVLTALQDSEWWCIPASLNKGRMPALTALRVPAGESVQLAAGTKLMVCDGELSIGSLNLSAGSTIETADVTASSTSGALGFIFSGEAP